jgi:hypothetical protein
MESLATKMNTTQGVNWEAEFQKYQSGKHRARSDAGQNWENSANKLLQEQEGKKKTGKLGRSSRSQRSDASIKYAGEHFFPDLEFRELGFNSQEEMTAFVNGVVDSLRKEQPGLTDPNAFREEAAKMLAITLHNQKSAAENGKFLSKLRELGKEMILDENNTVSPIDMEEFLTAFQAFRKPTEESELRLNIALRQLYKSTRNTNSMQRMYEMALGVPKGSRSKDIPQIQKALGEFANIYTEINLATELLDNASQVMGQRIGGAGLEPLHKAKSEMIEMMRSFLIEGNDAMYKINAITEGTQNIQIRVVAQQVLLQAAKFYSSLGNTDYAELSSDILEAIEMFQADIGEDASKGLLASLPENIQQSIIDLVSSMPAMFQSVVQFMYQNNIPVSQIPKLVEKNLEDLTAQDTSGMANILSGGIKMEDEEF